MTRANTKHQTPDSLYRILYEKHGELMSGSDLYQALGFKSAAAFRQAKARGKLPLRTFNIPGRRGPFALTKAVATWLDGLGRPTDNAPPPVERSIQEPSKLEQQDEPKKPKRVRHAKKPKPVESPQAKQLITPVMTNTPGWTTARPDLHIAAENTEQRKAGVEPSTLAPQGKVGAIMRAVARIFRDPRRSD